MPSNVWKYDFETPARLKLQTVSGPRHEGVSSASQQAADPDAERVELKAERRDLTWETCVLHLQTSKEWHEEVPLIFRLILTISCLSVALLIDSLWCKRLKICSKQKKKTQPIPVTSTQMILKQWREEQGQLLNWPNVQSFSSWFPTSRTDCMLRDGANESTRTAGRDSEVRR